MALSTDDNFLAGALSSVTPSVDIVSENGSQAKEAARQGRGFSSFDLDSLHKLSLHWDYVRAEEPPSKKMKQGIYYCMQ